MKTAHFQEDQDFGLISALKTHFGFDSFLPNQEVIVKNVLAGNDTIAIMPTGGGKSLCFQLPALLMTGTALVISPLISLMKDQVDSLKSNGIAAAYFNSSQSREEQQAVLTALQSQQLKLLYTAPESLPQLYFILKNIPVSLMAVDEAHCISTWGHDFRPAYIKLNSLKARFPDIPLIALTATADRATREDIAKQLAIPDAGLFVASFNRPNLYLEVRPGRDRLRQILEFIQERKEESGIIYCLSRKNTEKLAADIIRRGYRAEAYHAGMEAEQRTAIQENFSNDRTAIIVATIAFGMGIDKSNIRWIIHYNMPKNLEGYYQEIGRSGRDGEPAFTLLFHSFGDSMILRKFAEESSSKTYQLAKLERMQQYTEAVSCRRKVLLGYFGEFPDEDCGNCDICLRPPKYFDGTVIAQKICSAVSRLKEKEAMGMVIDVLRGARNARVYEKNYQHIKTYGCAADISWLDLQQYAVQLINQGILEIRFHENGRLLLTPIAEEVLFQNKKVFLSIPVLKKEKPIPTAATQKRTDLFEKLRHLRRALAEAENVPAFVVFSDAALLDMDVRKPRTIEEFSEVSGVGRVKLAKYGEPFLKLINEYLDNQKRFPQ